MPRTTNVERLLALVPSRLPSESLAGLSPVVRRALVRLRKGVQTALDLPSRKDLDRAIARLDALDRRIEAASEPETTTDETATTELNDDERHRAAALLEALEAERNKLRKLRKELKRELKELKKSRPPVINVGSPRTMRNRRKP